MTPFDLRQQLHAQIDHLPDDQLEQVQSSLAAVVSDQSDLRFSDLSPDPKFSTKLAEIRQRSSRIGTTVIRRGKRGYDLLLCIGTWKGDDLEDCVQFASETRSKAEF
jgi:hypothetical protein